MMRGGKRDGLVAESSAVSKTTAKLITQMRAEDTHTHTEKKSADFRTNMSI